MSLKLLVLKAFLFLKNITIYQKTHICPLQLTYMIM